MSDFDILCIAPEHIEYLTYKETFDESGDIIIRHISGMNTHLIGKTPEEYIQLVSQWNKIRPRYSGFLHVGLDKEKYGDLIAKHHLTLTPTKSKKRSRKDTS